MTDLEKIKTMVNRRIADIRTWSKYTDEELTILFTKQLLENPQIVESYEESEQKKLLHNITKVAQNIKSSPIKLARHVA